MVDGRRAVGVVQLEIGVVTAAQIERFDKVARARRSDKLGPVVVAGIVESALGDDEEMRPPVEMAEDRSDPNQLLTLSSK